MGEFKSSLAQAATVIVLATWPAYGADKAPIAKTENVTAQTRQKVTNLKLEFPNFKLSTDAKKCLDGELIDSECDSAINDEADIYKKKQQVNTREEKVNTREEKVNTREEKVNTREQQVQIAWEAMDNISIVLWLIQLWLYVDYDITPSESGNFIYKAMNAPNASSDVKELFKSFLARKKNGDNFTKWDGNRLIQLAQQHLDRADKLIPQITDIKSKEQTIALYVLANTSYRVGKEKISKKG